MSRLCSHPFRRFLAAFALLAAGPSFGARLIAEPITLDSNGAGSVVTVSFNGSSMTGFAGQFNMHVGNDSEFTAFCVDLPHDVSVGQQYQVNERSTNDGLTNGGEIAFLANAFGSDPLTNAQAAGLQIALWDLLYNNGATSGVFQYQNTGPNDPIAIAVASYLLAGANQSSTSAWFDAAPSGTGPNRGQSVVLADPPPPPSAVPEPSTFCLYSFGLGFMGLGYLLFQRIRAPQRFVAP